MLLPYRSYLSTAECLHNDDLLSQVVEATAVHQAIKQEVSVSIIEDKLGMWRGILGALQIYQQVMARCAQRRGLRIETKLIPFIYSYTAPSWFSDDDDFYKTHQAYLLRHRPDWYRRFGWKVDESLELVYPEHKELSNEDKVSKYLEMFGLEE